MGLIVVPLAIEDVAIHVIENASSMRLIILPIAFVASAIRPSLLSKAVPETPKPLAAVYGSVLKSVLSFFLGLPQLTIFIFIRILAISTLFPAFEVILLVRNAAFALLHDI